MGLGSTKQKATYINIKLKGETPIFLCKESGLSDGKFYGNLTALRIKEANEKADFPTIMMEFYDDKNDRYIVSGGFTNIMTSIINTFAKGVEKDNDFKNLCLSLYDKDGFARIGIFQNGEMMPWKYEMTELNKMTEKKRVNGKDVTDREALDKFLRTDIESIGKYLKEKYGDDMNVAHEDVISDEEEDEKTPGEKLREKAKKDDNNDDLPF